MKTKYEVLNTQILKGVGGKDNINSVTHCATRLRFTLKDKGLIDHDLIKSLKEVLGTQSSGGQYQIIIGPQVREVCEEFSEMIGLSTEILDHEALKKTSKKLTPKGILNSVFNTLSGCIIPIFPIFIGAGLIKMLVSILGPNLLNLFAAESDLMVLLTFVGDAGFYFFPIFAAWSAAVRFKTSVPIALFMASILIHPSLIAMVAEGSSFSVYGIPMTLTNYANQFLPSILMVWVLSHVFKFLESKIPNALRTAFVPVLSILIMLPITLCVLGPIGTYGGILIGDFATWLAATVGPLAIGLIGGLWYFLVALGMDKALLPIILNAFATVGHDNLFWLSAVVATYSLIGVAVAFVIRCKKEDRAMGTSSAITLLLGGVSEPVIYGIIFRFKKAMIYLFTGGFVGGVLVSIFNVKAYTIGAGNVLFFTVFAGGDGTGFIPGIIACAIAFGISLSLGLIFGFNDKSGKNVVKEN